MKRISLLTTFCLMLMCKTAPAPLSGSFPGLDQLIDRAEFIVVAEIIKRPGELDFDLGGGGIFEIQFVKVLKGKIKEGRRSKAYLRDLSFEIEPHNYTSLAHEFIQGQLYLLFLNTYTDQVRWDDKPLPVDFANENCSGDAVWIAQSPMSPSGYFDLESLKGKGVRESVVALLHHALNVQRNFAAAVAAMIESRAAKSLVQRVTQVLWFDNNAEAAADFYLSIFKGASKDPNLDRYRDVVPELGKVTGVKLWIESQEILLLNGGPKFKSTAANMVTVNCELQEEIDYYWGKLSAGGEKSKGGWVKDKFGVWWHVAPSDLAQLLGGKYGAWEQAMKALQQMDKIDSAALWRAAHDE